jgi:hypothetical protein
MALKTLPRKDQLAHLQKDQAGRNKISQLKEVVARDTLRILQRKLMFSIADLPRKEREAASEVLLAKFRLRLTATSSEKFIDELIIAQELAETLEQAGMSRAETIAPMTAASDSMTEEKEKR